MADEASTILLAIQGILQGMTRFAGHPERVTDGDYRILDSGVDEAIVLAVGPFDQEDDGQNRENWTYTILVDIFKRDQSDGLVWSGFRDLRGAVIEELRKYPQLNDSTLFVMAYDLSAEADPENGNTQGGAPFVGQEIRARYTIGVSITGGDYA
jgi:hypothetical protein